MDSVDALAQWRVENIGLVFTIISTEDHLSIVCADKDHTSGLGPSVAGEVC